MAVVIQDANLEEIKAALRATYIIINICNFSLVIPPTCPLVHIINCIMQDDSNNIVLKQY